LEDHLKAIIKPQYVDQIPKAIKVIFKYKKSTLNFNLTDKCRMNDQKFEKKLKYIQIQNFSEPVEIIFKSQTI
jgi:translation initiation factor RLI1